MSSCAIIGHGRSPEGKAWASLIDACDTVIRMWDCQWQDPAVLGNRYDIGLYELHPTMMATFHENVRRNPRRGWVASLLKPVARSQILPRTQIVDQQRWNEIGIAMGGLGMTGRLQFTRGTIAACWAIEDAEPGDRVILVGFDNIRRGVTLPLDQAFCPAYRGNPGSYSFEGYRAQRTKDGNHDFAIELPVMRRLAADHGVSVVFAEDVWPC
jgi:hypothetical protein